MTELLWRRKKWGNGGGAVKDLKVQNSIWYTIYYKYKCGYSVYFCYCLNKNTLNFNNNFTFSFGKL